MSGVDGRQPRLERVVLALWVAAASVAGSLAAVIIVLIGGRSIIRIRGLEVTALVLAVLCVVGVLALIARQERLQAARVRSTRPVKPAAEPRITPPSATPPPATPPPATASPATASSSATPTPAQSEALPATFAGVGQQRDQNGRRAAQPPWHEAATRGVAGSDRPPVAAGVPARLALPGGQQSAADDPAPPESSPAGQRQVIPLGTQSAGPTTPQSTVPQIVQCPRCGAFDVDAQLVRDGCSFECLGCGHPWHWRHGAPWPMTVLRPRLRRTRDSSGPAATPTVWQLPS